MTKSTKVNSKKVATPAEAQAVAPVVASTESVSAVTPVPAKKERAVKAPVDPAVEARARWARRLGRWQAKAQAAGVDAKVLMQEALAS